MQEPTFETVLGNFAQATPYLKLQKRGLPAPKGRD